MRVATTLWDPGRTGGMDDRLAGVAAIVVGVAVAVVGATEYVLPGLAPPLGEPLATGVFVVGTGVLLVVAGGMATRNGVDTPALRATAFVGLATLALAVVQPDSLLFGGVFWLGMVAVAFAALGTYRTFVAMK